MQHNGTSNQRIINTELVKDFEGILRLLTNRDRVRTQPKTIKPSIILSVPK